MEGENVDSTFHRMVETELDRKIKAVKTQFVDELKPRLLSNGQILSAELTHLELSIMIFINLRVLMDAGKQYLIKMQYDMDNRKFNVPWYESVIGYSFSSQDWRGVLSENPNLMRTLWYTIKSTFEVSKIPGLGTRRGDNWITDESTDQMANTFLDSLCGKK